MLRVILLFLLIAFLARAVWRLLEGVVQGALGPQGGGQRTQVPRGVKMERDPVCGTYVVPGKAVTLTRGGEQVFFCSDECRSKYGNRQPAAGRQDSGRR